MKRHTFIRAAFAATAIAALAGCSHMHGGGAGGSKDYPSAAPSAALMETYTATLSGAEEVPPTTTQGKGTFEMTLNIANNEYTWKMSYSGLSGAATAAHIHGPAAKGANAGVIAPLQGMEGKGKLTQAQYGDLAAGLYYVNVHTQQNPNGEIRGQLTRK